MVEGNGAVNATQRFAILTTVLGILTAGVLGLLVTMIRDHFTLTELVKDVRTLITDKDKDHAGLNERLTYLERKELRQYREKNGH
jgi:hypothetical protein